MKYQVCRPLTPIEFAALKADIADNGVLVPVEVDENGDILDGHHRVQAWQELREEGVSVPQWAKMVRQGLTEEQKRNHARKLNVLRRQMSKDERETIMVDMRRDGMSYRKIADAVGIDKMTVMRTIKSEGVSIDTPDVITGADGKTYPAQQPPKPTPPPSLFVPGSEALDVDASRATVAERVTAVRAAKEGLREERRQENAIKAAASPSPLDVGARFATILIDPPWDWGDEGDVNQMGRAKPDYATMSVEQLLELPVGNLADEDCHIYLWITNRSMPKGFALLDAWGFRYITCLTWVKPHFGMGNYFRGQTEHILFGVKGSQMLKRKNASTVFHADRGDGGHSSKPAMIHEFIESCSPGPYLEMFSRVKRDGWFGWGADA